MKEALPFFQAGRGRLMEVNGMAVSPTCLLRSVLLATVLRTSDGAKSARMCKLFYTSVGLRQPVMHLQLSLSAASTFFAMDDLSHTGQAYSAAE